MAGKKQLVSTEDVINHPHYYAGLMVEPINAIEAWGLGFHLGNAVKYIARAGRKTSDGLEDLKKARWYLDRKISNIESERAISQKVSR